MATTGIQRGGGAQIAGASCRHKSAHQAAHSFAFCRCRNTERKGSLINNIGRVDSARQAYRFFRSGQATVRAGWAGPREALGGNGGGCRRGLPGLRANDCPWHDIAGGESETGSLIVGISRGSRPPQFHHIYTIQHMLKYSYVMKQFDLSAISL